MTRRVALVAAAWLLVALPFPCQAAREKLELRHLRLDLPGPPSMVLPVDLDEDGRLDLFCVLAYTEVESIGVDRIENMMQISTVIPALFDRREARVYLAAEDGSYRLSGTPLRLEPSVLAVAAGPSSAPLVALTDDGVSLLRLQEGSLVIEPVISDPPVLAGAGSFFSKLDFVEDLNGDGEADLLLPSREGLSIYLATAGGLAGAPTQRLELPGAYRLSGDRARLRYPLPHVLDVNGDGHADLLIALADAEPDRIHLFLGNGDGTFEAARRAAAGCDEAHTWLPVQNDEAVAQRWGGEPVFFGDVDGDGRADLVTQEELEDEKDGLRAGMRQAKKPRQRFRVYHVREDLSLQAEPTMDFEVLGHAPIDTSGVFHPFRDLDGDGLPELITVTLDFSILQAVRVLTTKKISIGLDFHVWRRPEGATSFREVEGLDLSEKLKLDLGNLRLGRLAQFAGDFDGDGRIDFVHMGRGTQVTIHRGQEGCRYPKKPDLVLELGEELEDLVQVRIEDFDGDGRADFSVTRPLPLEPGGESAPVQLNLFLSRGAS